MRKNQSPKIFGAIKLMLAILVASAPAWSLKAVAAPNRDRVLLLFHSQAQNAALDGALPYLEGQGCTVWRRGFVAGAQGNLDIGSPDRFAMFICTSEILHNAQHRSALASILGAGTDVTAVEGFVLSRGAEETGSGAIDERAYVLKISYYNNSDPDGRERDLSRINAMAAERADAWKTAAIVSGVAAIGMKTPDEVTVIQYDNPRQGERFRDENADILEQIGAFNRSHLTEFTYISVSQDR